MTGWVVASVFAFLVSPQFVCYHDAEGYILIYLSFVCYHDAEGPYLGSNNNGGLCGTRPFVHLASPGANRFPHRVTSNCLREGDTDEDACGGTRDTGIVSPNFVNKNLATVRNIPHPI